jgi:putative ABC transport system permease protein
MNPALPIYSATTTSSLMAESLAQRRFVLMLLGAFSVVALILATIGIYGVITYTTAQRTREIGIRSALGAARADVLRLVLAQGFRIAMAGVIAGVAGALLLTRFLQGMLYGVAHTDPVTFALTALLLVLTAIAAAYVPARRAAGVDPAIALRYE